MKKIVFMGLVILLMVGCEKIKMDNKSYIKKTINLDVDSCQIDNEQEKKYQESDGKELFVELNCDKLPKEVMTSIRNWQTLPLSSILHRLVYEYEICDKKDCQFIAKRYQIPEIDNGKYLFINRHKEADGHDDENIDKQSSYNLTIVLYNLDENRLYFYELDK